MSFACDVETSEFGDDVGHCRNEKHVAPDAYTYMHSVHVPDTLVPCLQPRKCPGKNRPRTRPDSESARYSRPKPGK